MRNIQTVRRGTPQLARTWAAGVRAAGGGFENNSLIVATNLARVLQTKSYYPKMRYLMPFLGVGINAARVPLIDTLGVGAAANNSFVDGDFSQSSGLQGNGSGKTFDTLLKASQLSPSDNNAGFGYWALAVNVGGWSFGSRPAQGLYGFLLDNTPRELFYYGGADGSQVDVGNANGAYDYYAQRSSPTSRTIYQNAVSIGSTSSSTTDSGNNGANVFLMGIDGSFTTDGRCGAAYLTNGSLSVSEISDLHSTLSFYLMAPTGRI